MLKARPLVNRPRQVARIGYVYAAAGKKDEAIKILDEMKRSSSERYDLGSYIASIYAALGNKEQAFAWLEKALDDRDNAVVDLKADPRFDALRSDPRFTALLRQVRLAP
jgi:tetratricopeptide (TPR) repeat protein